MSNDRNLLIANKYAESLVEFSKDGKITFEQISNDLATITKILDMSNELFKVLTNPMVSLSNKLDIIGEVFDREVNPSIKSFLKILVEKNRFSLIYAIVESYNKKIDVINNIQRLEVVSAVALNDEERHRVHDKLTFKLNKDVKIEYNVDDSIIAGLVIKMDDDIIDMSVARKLSDLKKTITK